MSYSKILDNLYQGNQYSTKIVKNIDIIISIGCNSKHTLSNIENIKFSVKDKFNEDITLLLDLVCEFIHNNILNNKKVLVHCKAGINRSSAFIVAYLIKHNNMNLEEAKKHILKVRKVKFKKNFMDQIKKHFELL